MKKNIKEPEEKRMTRFKSSPTIGEKERIARALQQQMFLISRKDINPLEKEFTVLGSVGNVYTVLIKQVPSCTCPDFQKGNLCKHILFVFLKVLKSPSTSHFHYQKSLLKSELEILFANSPKDPSAAVMAKQSVVSKYQELTGEVNPKKQKTEDENVSSFGVKRHPMEKGDDCPICYEEMKAKDDLVWCMSSCGNNVHKGCFKNWATAHKGNVTCVYCRANWIDASNNSKSKNGGVSMNEGFVNLANLQGISKERPEYVPDDNDYYGYRGRYKRDYY